jgi:hypothetical protein
MPLGYSAARWQPKQSHLAHVELRQGATADAAKPKRAEMTRRSTPCVRLELPD